MKSKAAVGVSIDILKTKRIWPPVRNLHCAQALHGKAVVAAEESPNATHAAEELQALLAARARGGAVEAVQPQQEPQALLLTL